MLAGVRVTFETLEGVVATGFPKCQPGCGCCASYRCYEARCRRSDRSYRRTGTGIVTLTHVKTGVEVVREYPAGDTLRARWNVTVNAAWDLRQAVSRARRAAAMPAVDRAVPANGTVRLPNGRRTTIGALLSAGPGWQVCLMTGQIDPRTPEPHIGVEIEFGAPLDGDHDSGAIRRSLAAAGLAKHAHLGSDGSVRVPHCESHELRLCAPESQILSVVARACGALAEHDAAVNRTCGLHVHLDVRPVTGRNWRECHRRLYRALPWLYALVPPSRRNNQYCRRNRSAAPARGRYFAINSQSVDQHQTLELRLHSGTVDARKITAWVQLLIAVMSRPAPARMTRDLYRFAAHYSLPLPLTAYLGARIDALGTAELEGISLPALTASAVELVAMNHAEGSAV